MLVEPNYSRTTWMLITKTRAFPHKSIVKLELAFYVFRDEGRRHVCIADNPETLHRQTRLWCVCGFQVPKKWRIAWAMVSKMRQVLVYGTLHVMNKITSRKKCDRNRHIFSVVIFAIPRTNNRFLKSAAAQTLGTEILLYRVLTSVRSSEWWISRSIAFWNLLPHKF